jgi:ABC-type transporter Mla subunit MlaD
MQRIPGELAAIARETRGLLDRVRDSAGCAASDIAELTQRLDEVEKQVRRLCNVATQAVNIAPLWRITQEKDDDGH